MLTVDANVWVAAFDPRDRFHEQSTVFLRTVSRAGLGMHGPALVTLEVACALARRAGDPAVGNAADARLKAHPTLTLHPVDETCLLAARDIGLRFLLRGADALYAATAELFAAPLISWDNELVQRAGARTPDMWLDHGGGLR